MHHHTRQNRLRIVVNCKNMVYYLRVWCFWKFCVGKRMNTVIDIYMDFIPLILIINVVIILWASGKYDKFMLWMCLFLFVNDICSIVLFFIGFGNVLSLSFSIVVLCLIVSLFFSKKSSKYIAIIIGACLILVAICYRYAANDIVRGTTSFFKKIESLFTSIDYKQIITDVIKSEWINQVSIGVATGVLTAIICRILFRNKKTKENKDVTEK